MLFKEYKELSSQILKNINPSDVNALEDLFSLLVNFKNDGHFDDYSEKDKIKWAMDRSKFIRTSAMYIAGISHDKTDKCIDLYWRCLLLEAPHIFESFLIYLEKNREYPSKFYEPKAKQLNKHGLIQAMQDLEDDKLKLLTISMPPGTQKTTLEKFFTAWVIGRHPEDYSLFFSHSGDITRMFYDGVLDIISNNVEYTWHEIFPNCQITKTDAKREQININKYKPFPNLQTSSVGSKNAGKVRCNLYLLCDDLISGIEEALSKTRLAKLWDIYSIDARQRKLNQEVKEIHICTRWSTADVIGRLKAAYGDDPRCRFIAIEDIDPETGESNFDYEFNGMTVEFFNDQEKLMDDISYQCLYKNRPIEREGLLYRDDELRRYLTLPAGVPDAVLSICDTKEKGADDMAMPVCFVYGQDHYMVDAICDDNTDFTVQYENIVDKIIKNDIQVLEFERNNGGSRVAYDVNKILEERKHKGCAITENQTTSNKETRIIVNSKWVKDNMIFKDKSMYTPKSNYGRFMAKLLSYSTVGKNEHDDVPDGVAMYSEFVKRRLSYRPPQVMNSPM